MEEVEVETSDILNNRWFQIGGAAAASFALGVALGYFLGKREYQELVEYYQTVDTLEQELDAAAVYEATSEKYEELTAPYRSNEDVVRPDPVIIDASNIEVDDDADPSEIIDSVRQRYLPDAVDVEVHEEVTESQQISVEGEEGEEGQVIEETVTHQNVFADSSDSTWDYEVELAARRPQTPYILHQDEFYQGEMDLPQIQLTYYAGDDILVDDKDQPIDNHARVVGELKFGHGTTDPNVVYVRNEELRAEYEILHHTGHYQIEVLGHHAESELERDSERPRATKFRGE